MMLLVLLLQIADILSFCKIFLSASMAKTGEGFSLASSGPTYGPTAAAFLSISGVKDSDSNLFTACANPAEDDDDNVDVGSAPPLPRCYHDSTDICNSDPSRHLRPLQNYRKWR